MANARCAPIDLGGGAGDSCVTIALPRLRVRLRLMVTVHDVRGLAQFFDGGKSKAGEEVDAENLCLTPSNCERPLECRERSRFGQVDWLEQLQVNTMNQHTVSQVLPTRSRLIVLIGVLTIVAAANHFVLSWMMANFSVDTKATLSLAVFYILQIGAISVFCGYGEDPTWLKWTNIGWLFALINLQLLAVVAQRTYGTMLPLASLFAGQYGLLIAWAVLGAGRWFYRIPIVVVFLTLLSMCSAFGVNGVWSAIVSQMCVAVTLILLALRFLGFRMRGVRDADGREILKSAQFGLRHALIMTTVLAVLMGALKAFEPFVRLAADEMIGSLYLVQLYVGASSAVVVVFACWAAMGRGSAAVRYMVLLAVAGTVGTIVFLAFKFGTGNPGGASYASYQYGELAKLSWQWILWFVLTGAMLVACLMFLRVQGLRLIKEK